MTAPTRPSGMGDTMLSPQATAVDETTPPSLSTGGSLEAFASGPREAGALIGAVIAQKYKLEQLLGHGGMGEVYRAQHLTLGIDVAVKVMHARVAADQQFARRFAREARAISVLSHPSIVRVIDFGADAGVPYLVMEFLRGRSLGAYLDGLRAPPPLAVVGELLSPVLAALAVAHAAGVVHRDLKPDNVFLAEVGGAIVPKLVDFGLAHVDDPIDRGPTLTQTEMVAGTPDYMSPEQCRSLRVGPASDLYAFGCLLTTLLQLKPPFDGISSVDLITKHMFAPVPPLARPDGAEPVPAALETLRLALLAKDAERRPESAEVALERLRAILDPASLDQRMAARAHDSLAPREARAAWSSPPPASAEAVSTAARHGTVSVVHLGEARDVTDAHELALAAQGVTTVPTGDEAASVVVLDAGDDLDGALAWLASHPGRKVLVSLRGLPLDRMNRLVAAGAADAIGAPPSGDAIARKVVRIVRRGR